MNRTGPHLDRRDFLGGAAVLAGSGLISLTALGASPQTAGPVVDTAAGKVRGSSQAGIHSFKGIPYGASTAGANRFMPPVKPQPWTGVRECMKYGHQSPQNMAFTDVLAPQADPSEGFTEDCLVLNLWTPGVNDGRKRPVMFWIHGGGYSQESGSWPWIDGAALARRGDAVVITVNHRLNIFGYLHLGDIGGEKYAASGNAGMLDLVAALQWVRDSIAQFGGDPGNVMIFGESGGGAKTCMLLGMPAAKGLFHRAAIQSGSSLRGTPREDAAKVARSALDALGISVRDVDALQRLPVEKLLTLVARNGGPPPKDGLPRLGFSPVVDGRILPAHPFDPATPISADIPLLVGCTQYEATLFTLQDSAVFTLDDAGMRARVKAMFTEPEASRLVDVYRKANPAATPSDIFLLIYSDRLARRNAVRLSERKAAQGRASVHMYLFAWKSPALGGKLRSPHTVEIPFVFDNTDIPTVMTRAPSARELAARVSSAWIAFARSGNPNCPQLPQWQAYDAQRRATMVFDNECRVVNDPGSAERQAWGPA
ncbi:MAG: carboxylesterase/lipase family protein [Pseudomonadota bacterium]